MNSPILRIEKQDDAEEEWIGVWASFYRESQSGRGLPHSKTCRKEIGSGNGEAFGVRQSSAALGDIVDVSDTLSAAFRTPIVIGRTKD